MKKLISTLTIVLGASISVAHASDADILNTLNKLGYPTTDIKIESSPIASIKTVISPAGVLYITEDGQFITPGPIFSMQGDKPENIANPYNAKLIASIDKNAIVYQAENEKYVISVFTDYTCTYCKKLHQEIQSYLDAGISVHYFAFPRQGLNSQVAKDMQSIWSAVDRKAAFDNAYKGGTITPASSLVPFVKTQYEVGRQIGLTGTPAIVLQNGQLLSGYVPAAELIKVLDDIN